MKKVIAIIAATFLLAACSMPSNNWDYPEEITKDNNNYKASLTVPCTTVMGAKQCTGFNLSITNKTNNMIKIIWDESVVVQDNNSSAVLPDGVRYIERDSSKTDTVIPKGLTINKSFTPNSNIYWSKELRSWQYYLLTPGNYKVFVQLEVNGKKHSEEFDFKIVDRNSK